MPGESGRMLRAVEFVQQAIGDHRQKRAATKNPDEFLQRALAEWPLFDQLIARIYVDYQKAEDRIDIAAIQGLPSKDREIGFMTALKQHLAWMTKYASPARAKSRATKGL